MKLENLISQCADALQEEAGQDKENYYGNAYWGRDPYFNTSVKTDDGEVSLFYYLDNHGAWSCEVQIDHNQGYNECPNLEGYLSEQLSGCVDWDVVFDKWHDDDMDIYQRNGFDSESDFWHWKEGY